MTLKEKYNLLLELQERIKDLEKEKELLKVSILEEISPYKVGDVTTVKGYVCVGKKCKIQSIYLKEGGLSTELFDIKIRASVLKLNGEPSVNIVRWDAWEDSEIKHALVKLTGKL